MLGTTAAGAVSGPIIEAEQLNFAYNGPLVLSDISFQVEPGAYIGLIGPNGGGKTTLLKLLLGLEKGRGQIKLFGQKLSEFKDWHKVGYLAQKSPVGHSRFPISVEEVVFMGLTLKSIPKNITPEHLKLVHEALSKTNTLPLAKSIFHNLSVGQQQRILLARAIVSTPKLLILDEPSAALDGYSREMFFELLGTLNKEHGTTILLITHDTGEVGKYISQFMYVDRELIFFGTREAFCQSERVAKQLGSFAQHTIDHLHNHGGNCPLEAHACGGHDD